MPTKARYSEYGKVDSINSYLMGGHSPSHFLYLLGGYLMAYVAGYATDSYSLLTAIDKAVTNNGWKAVYQHLNSSKNLDLAIWEGVGDGNDKIYIEMRVVSGGKLALDGLAGYDKYLDYYEQPGSIQQHLKAYLDYKNESSVDQPILHTTDNELFYYWVFVDNYRLIVVTRMAINYESCYCGLVTPIASERQFPYPMYVAGNSSVNASKTREWNDTHLSGSFVFPANNSGFLRRADGLWRSFASEHLEPSPTSKGTVFPYNSHNKKLIPNYKGAADSSIVQDNFLLIPIILQTTDPIDMCGILRDVYWVSGTRDLSAEQTFECEGSTYICFDTKQFRDSNSYFCIKQ